MQGNPLMLLSQHVVSNSPINMNSRNLPLVALEVRKVYNTNTSLERGAQVGAQVTIQKCLVIL